MARDAQEKTEFLTSTSERFRPVNIYDGPDGAIYITDIARGVVQHITYVTPWLRRQILERGLEQPLSQGRIWRIVPEGGARRPIAKLSKASAAELVAQFSNANGWVRDAAQRLLVERADPASVSLLEKVTQNAPEPLARLHALWTLEGLEKLQPRIIGPVLADKDPKVRAAGIRLLEPFLKTGDDAAAEPVFKMLDDQAADVQLQLLLTLGELKTPRAEEAMVKLLARLSENRLARAAAISGLRGREVKFLELLGAAPDWREESSGRVHVIAQIARCVLEGRQPVEVTGALDLVVAGKLDAPWKQIALLKGIGGIVPLAEPPPDSIAAAQARIGAKPQPAPGLPQSFKPLKVATEPPQLAALQALTDPAVQQAATKVNAIFAWPGKPGYVEEKKPPPLTADQKKFVESGKQLYLLICAACHQPTGLGQEGLAPPLAASDWAVGPESRLVRIVLQGIGGPLSVNGKEYSLDMPGLALALNDEQIAQILSYIRRDLGNEAPVVSTASVKKIRDATKDRGASWTADELRQIN
jgi:mono/diheme cytochrome c family protein